MLTKIMRNKLFSIRMSKVCLYVASIGISLYSVIAFAAINTIGEMAGEIVKSFVGVGKLMIGTSYLAGIGFVIASIFKFKQHKDNPTNIPVGTPVALLAIGVVMIFLPGLISPVGHTIFGSGDLNSIAGGFTGNGASKLPGGNV